MLKKILNLEGVQKVEKQQQVHITGGGRGDGGFEEVCAYDNVSAVNNGCPAQNTDLSWGMPTCIYVCVSGRWVRQPF
ncbi:MULTISPECIES: hypothetical protein [Flavobacterium]|uniref:hypothetical protein n=1 Tax=Flavobacterium TaxID=237 RepID=UPI0009663474|nr:MULTISPECIES: hypothetical protein [Flavobacterium]MBN9284924.1 hypothetical protein [Flavobacterium sp.]OJV72235.1 MAG: hypothetical protein BGO42_03350 [Flavobacterium sp. 40-81]